MPEENLEPKENTVDETTDSNVQLSETNSDEEKTVTISEHELSVLKKKAEDFERSVELKRLAKLQKKDDDPKPDGDDKIAAEVAELRAKIEASEVRTFNQSLSEAYHQFVLDHPWANTDDAFDKIKEKFSISGNETKEELFSKLKGAAQTVFPVEYEKHLEEKIKSKVLSQKNLGTDNGTAVSANILHKDDNLKTEEDMRKERLGSLLRKHTPWLNKK